MRRINRYSVYEKLKAGKLPKSISKDLEKYGLLKDYETFEDLQAALIEALKARKSTRRKLGKFRKYIHENPIDAPFSSTSPALRYLAEKFRLNHGDIVAFLRANAFKHVPATKRYIRPKRYESPLSVYTFISGGRKRWKYIKDKFSEDDLATAILAGEVALYSGNYKKYYYTLRIAELRLKHDGPYALEEPPNELKGLFERGERHVENKEVRRLMIEPKDSDVVVVIK